MRTCKIETHSRWNPPRTLNNRPGTMNTSESQKSRVFTELWVEENTYSPLGGNCCVSRYPAHTPESDFFCPSCQADFERKSKNVTSSRRPRVSAGGSWHTLPARVRSACTPHLVFRMRQGARLLHRIFILPFFFTHSVTAP